jgi:hypothetical protein
MFETFYAAISRITSERKSMPTEDVLALYKSLMDLTIQIYPKNLENVDKIFSVALPVLTAKKNADNGTASMSNIKVVKGITALLKSPIENYHNVLTVLVSCAVYRTVPCIWRPRARDTATSSSHLVLYVSGSLSLCTVD